MRIQTSEYYHGKTECTLVDCERHYCKEHRLLWADCDTAKTDFEGSGERVVTLGICPRCELVSTLREAKRAQYAWLQAHPGSCPECFNPIGQWDDVAVHLMGVHGYDYDKARLFLRDRIEEVAFNGQP